jgi:hypothetical protein
VNIPAMKALANQLMDEVRYPQSPRSWAALKITIAVNASHRVVYSVLGVMADVYIRAKQPGSPCWEDPDRLDEPHIFCMDTFECLNDKWRLDIPKDVLDWYGISREQSTQLCLQAMRGYSFQQIGKSIMKEVEKARRVA